MILWNTKALADTLRSRGLSQKEQAQYATLLFVATALMACQWLAAPPPDGWMWANNILHVLLTLLGCLYVYRINRRSDDKDFLLRLISLGWPVALRTVLWGTLMVLPVVMAWFMVAGVDHAQEHRFIGLVCLACTVAANIWCYGRVGHWMQYVARGATPP